MKIALDLIKPSPNPIRTTWDDDKLLELAQSIKEQGLIVPIKVRPIKEVFAALNLYPCRYHDFNWVSEVQQAYGLDGELCSQCDMLRERIFDIGENEEGDWAYTPKQPVYEIVYGHRRTEAARRAGLIEIEATVEGLDDTESLVQALIENLQREDMSPMDTARGLKALKDTTGWTNRDIAERGIMAVGQVSKMLSLLEQPEIIQKMMSTDSDGITPLHVLETKAVIADEPTKIAVLQKAANEGLTAAQTRRVAESIAQAPSEQAKRQLLEWEYTPTIHNPEWIEERAKEHGAHDPLYMQLKPAHDQQWKDAPAVTAILDHIKNEQDWLAASFDRAIELGKLDPAGYPFMAKRLQAWAQALIDRAEKLEQPNG